MHENGVATAPAGSSRWRPTALLLLCLTSVGVTAHDWSFLIGDVRRDTRVNMHRVVTELRAEQPHRYRLLTPVLLDIPVKFFARYMPYDDAFGRVYTAFYFLSFTLTIYALFAYLRLFFAESEALVGALMAAATMDVGLRGYDWSPQSHIEPALLCFGLILIYRERHAWLALLILVASLNRETGVFLPLLFFLVKPLTMQRLKVGAGLMAMWAVPFVALRWWLGPGPPTTLDLGTIWHGNTHSWEQITYGVVHIGLIYGVFWILAIAGYRHAPRFIKGTALVIPFYLVTVAVWGFWVEVRLLQPLYPEIIGLGLSYLYPPGRAEQISSV